MKKFFTRQNMTIAVAILLVAFVIYSRNRESSEGSKTIVRQYLVENGESIKEGGMHFLVYGEFKKVTDDEDVLQEVLVAGKAGDVDKLNEILEGL